MAGSLRTAGLLYICRGITYSISPQSCTLLCKCRSTSESDFYAIGIGPYADTLCRLDGGKDHKTNAQQISAENVNIIYPN